MWPLGLAGIPVVLATHDVKSLALASRYIVGRLMLPEWGGSGEVVAEAVLDVGERLFQETGSKIPLFYGTDNLLSLIYRFREPLAKHYHLILNGHDLWRSLLEKDRFHELAKTHDLPILTINGKDAAYIMGIGERGFYYDVTISFSAEFEALSPGTFLMQEVLKGLPARGIHTVISHGVHDYKLRWATGFPSVHRCFIFSRGLRGTLSRIMKFTVAPALTRLLRAR